MPTFERVRALREAGVGRLRLMRFNQALSNMSAEQFVRRVLFEEMKAVEVWVGEDFRFGHKRSGDVALLQELGTHYGFSVNTLMRMDAGGSRVSATRVRAALKSADFTEAARLLGRPYSYARRVIHGHKLGRKLGYPTANLRWESPTHEFSGIFAVRVSGAGLVRHPAIASLGTRPTVGGVTPLLEVHLFDFDGDLYGHKLEVEFVAKQRDEMKFEGLDPLIEQMRKDCGLAREILAQQKSVQGASDV
jgi:riboflavin kinase/FMN adenylyltransferase